MKGLEIIQHKPRHEDERGNTFGYIAKKKIKEILIVRRKKGTYSGNHYHTGSDPTRNPEIQYIISGRLNFIAKNLDTNEEESHILGTDTEIRIHPRVFHRLEMLEDTIFAEFHTETSDFKDVVNMTEKK